MFSQKLIHVYFSSAGTLRTKHGIIGLHDDNVLLGWTKRMTVEHLMESPWPYLLDAVVLLQLLVAVCMYNI